MLPSETLLLPRTLKIFGKLSLSIVHIIYYCVILSKRKNQESLYRKIYDEIDLKFFGLPTLIK
jgi:hypothetical protein